MAKKICFGDFPAEYSGKGNASIAIVPVPYDGTSTWIKGANKGPDAIISASPNLEFYDIETESEVYKKGIFTDEPVKENGSPEKMIDAVEKRVTAHINEGRFTVMLGGEHSVSIGAVKAHVKHYTDACVLQLDAHPDLRQEYLGSRYNHSCVMARVRELCPVVHVGIRSMDASEKKYMETKNVFFAWDIHNSKSWIVDVVSRLSKNVYMTIDLDVFDPSVIASTGTPEPGGLMWYDVIGLIRKVAEEKNLIGFDVVELCPGSNKAPDFTAAKLVYTMLSYKFKGATGGNKK